MIAKVENLERPDPAFIKFISGILEKAKSGELRALAYVQVVGQGTVYTGWEQAIDFKGYHFVNSGAATLSARIANAD